MSNWYASREQVKRAANLEGTDLHAAIDRLLESVSRTIDSETHTRFIPITQTRYLPWSSRWLRGSTLTFDADLWSLTSLTDQGTTARTLTSGTHFILQPENYGPPYYSADILLSQALTFESGSTTPQRSFAITGLWSRYSATKATGATLQGAIGTTTATTIEVDNSALIDVGHTLLIGSEQMFITERNEIDLGVNTAGALTADDTDVTLTLGDPTDNLVAGETIRIDSERMRVIAVSSATIVTVERAVDGTNLAAHLTAADIYVGRQFTVERGVNGTTAATAADNAAITRYAAPGPIEEMCIAEVIAALQQERSGWGRTVGTGERQVEMSGRALSDLRRRVTAEWRRNLMVSV